MPTRKLSVRATLTGAVFAPFSLEAASWRVLAGPGVTLVIASLFPLVAAYLQWNGTATLLSLLPVWAAVVWFAVDFQRHLLLGAAASRNGPAPWRRNGIYFLVLVFTSILLAAIVGILLYMVMPSMVFFMMAVNSPSPWLATGTVVLWVLVAGIAAYPLVRFALMLPAVAAGHDLAPRRVWRLSRGNGLRLILLLILIPGLLNGILYIAFPQDNDSLWVRIPASLLNACLALTVLSMLTLAYRSLSDQPLPAPEHGATVRLSIPGARVPWPFVLVLLASLVGIAAWNSLYRIVPGDQVVIFRLDKPVRYESTPGFRVKLPFLEDARPVAARELHRTAGTGRFFTSDKDMLALRYVTRWRVADAEIYARTTAGQPRLVDMKIDELLTNELHNRLAQLGQDEIRGLLGDGTMEFTARKNPRDDALLDDVIGNINSRVSELGIELTAWRLATVNPSGVDSP